jgi:arylsulfatase A-like enzyme/Tfp pilus assembly protein PilF
MVSLSRVSAAAAVVALALSVPRPAPLAAQQARPNILLITVDTTRADRIGAYGYKLAETPNLDRLSREGIRFADATTESPLTGPAHASLMTGQYPGRLGVRNNASSPVPADAVTLAESLRAAGYHTGAFIGAFIVDKAYGFGQGFETFDADFPGFRQDLKAQVQRPAQQVVDAAMRWIKGSSTESPFFAWIHLYDAHTPYAAPAPFGARFKGRPYDGEVAYVDAQIGRVLAMLRASGQMDRTAVAVIADHGESLGDHQEDEHGIFLYDSVMRIPWIMRLPASARVQDRVITDQVRSVDLTPTLLDLAGVQQPAKTDGESLTALINGKPRQDPPPAFSETWYPQLHFGWSRLRALRVGEWKYIDAPKPELYDLRTDAAERRNVIAERGSVAARMSAELDAVEKSFGAAAGTPVQQPDAETVARLRSLGYAGLAAPPSGTGRGPDPKDKIAEFNEFKTLLTAAGDDLRDGRADAALATLERALALNERAYDAHVMLGSVWQMKADIAKAVGEFDAAAILNPTGAAPHLLAANALLQDGRLESALKRTDRAAELEPASGDVAAMRGRIFERAGRGEQALAEYDRAVQLNPADMPARGRLASLALSVGQYDRAGRELRILLGAQYQLSRTHFMLGKLAEARGDKTTAAAEYRRTLALEPTFAPARQALAALGK